MPWWDARNAELVAWDPEDDRFSMDRAVEVSGLCLTPSALFLASEKYPLLLALDPAGLRPPRVIELGLPKGAEVEGLAWSGGSLYLCDEANAAVYRVPLPPSLAEGRSAPDGPLAVQRLPIEGVHIDGGKSGLEGIAVTEDGTDVVLLHERARDEAGCFSTLYRFRLTEDRLILDGPPVRIALEDCTWRLSDLSRRHGSLFGLKTRFPGERYEVVLIDERSGSLTTVLDLTDVARAAAADGYSNNLEGLAVAEVLFVVSDNAATPRAMGVEPGSARQTTLLIRVPAALGPHTTSSAPKKPPISSS